MATFELCGAATDETRLLVDRESRYSVLLPGRPSLAAQGPGAGPRAARRRAPLAVWSPSALAAPCAKLTLTDAAFREAQAKARDVGPLTDADTDALVDMHARRIAMLGPTRAAEALLRNIAACRTAHDLRAWVWQCIWAIGNRTDRGPDPRPPEA